MGGELRIRRLSACFVVVKLFANKNQLCGNHNNNNSNKFQRMSSSEEDDYMSDKFSCEKVPDVRPGLVFSQKRKREMQIHSKKAKIDDEQKSKTAPSNSKFRQQEELERGLATAIPKSNIGFSLLAKMGYKEGTSLGKTGQHGIVQPIGIKVKADRKGLGREAAVVKVRERQKQLAMEKMLRRSTAQECDPNEFRMRMVRKSQLKQVEGDLSRCQRACERLDVEMQFEEPTIHWFWPEKPVEDTADDGEEEETEDEGVIYEPHEKLELVNDYLRTTHLYCHWCGVKYETVEDMETNCPGPTRDDH